MSRETREHLEERVWAYLDRAMSAAEVDRFERELLDPEVSTVLAEVLLVRAMLSEVGPDEAPAALVRATQREVLRELRREQPEERRFARARAALDGLAWAARGPGLALSTNSESTRAALAEVGNVRHTLAPLAALGERGDGDDDDQEVGARGERRPALWRRLLRRGR